MTKLGAIFWVVMVVAAGLATFKVKYAVQDIEDQLNRVRKQTIAEQQEIRVLTAEWTYLNQPERLDNLNRRFLTLAPVVPKQLQVAIADLPLRPPPAAAPDELVTAAPGAVAPQPPAAPLPVARTMLAAANKPAPAVRLAKATSAPTSDSLDALIAQIAEAR
jgi:hypothetical protein